MGDITGDLTGDLAPEAQWEPRYAGRAERMRASEIRELLKLRRSARRDLLRRRHPRPGPVPRQGGGAAYAPFWRTLSARLPACSTRRARAMCRCAGGSPRTWSGMGVPCTEDNIVVTCGSQQALEFLGRLLLSPRDTAMVTAPDLPGRAAGLRGRRAPLRRARPRAWQPHARILRRCRCPCRGAGEARLRGAGASPTLRARRCRLRRASG